MSFKTMDPEKMLITDLLDEIVRCAKLSVRKDVTDTNYNRRLYEQVVKRYDWMVGRIEELEANAEARMDGA